MFHLFDPFGHKRGPGAPRLVILVCELVLCLSDCKHRIHRPLELAVGPGGVHNWVWFVPTPIGRKLHPIVHRV